MRRPLTALVLAASLGAAAPAALAAPDEPRTGSFTALSYNVAGLPEPLSGSEPATNSPLISPLLNAYDVVLLQEDWVDVLAQHGLRVEGAETIPRTGYHDLVVGAAEHPHRSVPMGSPPPPDVLVDRLPTGPTLQGDGLNHLAVLPLGDTVREPWDVCHGELHVTAVETAAETLGVPDPTGEDVDGGSADCGAQKGFSMTAMQLAGGLEVHVYNLHADAGGHPNDIAARRANFAQLAGAIERWSSDAAVIIGGDTNLRTGPGARDDATWRTFLGEAGLRDVCDVVDCGADAGEIDKFAFRSGPDVRIVPQSHAFERERFVREDGAPLSDHDALAVTFRWVDVRR